MWRVGWPISGWGLPALPGQAQAAVSLFLDTNELSELTGRVRRQAQRGALNFMGIEHKVRPDGSLVVAREHVEKLFGVPALNAKPPKQQGPDLSWM